MSGKRWHSLLAEIERTRTRNGRLLTGCYSLEGVRLVERAVRANIPLKGVLVSPQFAQDNSPRVQKLLTQLHDRGCAPITAPVEVVTAVTQGRGLGDILALAPLPPKQTLPTLQPPLPQKPLVLVAANIIDPGNVGALIRTAHAGGADAFVALGASDPYHPKAVRTSMGSLFKMPVAQYEELADLLADCQQMSIGTMGTVSNGGMALIKADFGRGTAVFMGNEYHGLDSAIISQLNQKITIPMKPGVDSYSVNAAAAIILYEARRGNGD
ncbi:MAG: RNA methyltransferase [Candidatus Promineifilaceae bacterium]